MPPLRDLVVAKWTNAYYGALLAFILQNKGLFDDTRTIKREPSLIRNAGFGVFAKRSIKEGEKVGSLIGRLVRRSSKSKSLCAIGGKFAPYCAMDAFTGPQLLGGKVLGHFANDPRGTPNEANAYLKRNVGITERNEKVWFYTLVALRSIDQGEEILVDYGAAYWQREDDDGDDDARSL
jgi:hypothetical protein